MLRYFCCHEHRRAAVRDPARNPNKLNGIDFLEVIDDGVPAADRLRILQVHFVNPPAAPLTGLTAANVRITGGVRVREVRAEIAKVDGNILEVHVDVRGDFSPYTLQLVDAHGGPLPGVDPLLSSVEFSFKVDCPTDLDCRTERVCPPEAVDAPDIDYLAKDYASFRQLMLDRLSLLAPRWQERNPADLGIALVELLAYVGDRLSYQQDAAATEAYLGTARQRGSVRRHARLLDYPMHDGCNARVWVQVRVNADDVQLPQGTPLFTTVGSAPQSLAPGSRELDDALAFDPVVFETLHDVTLYRQHERLLFYTWGEEECCLPRGATRATLQGTWSDLKRGDVLVLVEETGPRTGQKEDADPKHRHPVRLTADAETTQDPLSNAPVTEIEWAEEDALPFPLCISATADLTHGAHHLDDVSVALGNIVLADHGRTVVDPARDTDRDREPLPPVPPFDPRLARISTTAVSACDPREPEPVAPRYRPRLKYGPVTMVATVARTGIVAGRRRRLAFDSDAPAAAAFPQEMERVLPAVELRDEAGRTWLPRRDLLASDAFALEFVVEGEDDGLAGLRFGDDEYGLRPGDGTQLMAKYRIGNGVAGNIGAGSLRHIVTTDARIGAVYNPLPARGGVDPEPVETVRQNAPSAFRVQQRTVTPEDYARVAERHPGVQRAAATLRWTGSWHTVFLSVDRVGGREVDEEFKKRLRAHLEQYRMAGHDLEINGPHYVPLEIELSVCVLPDYYRSDVKAALIQTLSNQSLPDGSRGFFHPDNFTFGQSVYLSALYSAVQAVQGVRFVEVPKFQRLGLDSPEGLADGELKMSLLEIARLDNDPNFRDRGLLDLKLRGGQ
jgi:hypothetical protein